MTETDSSLTLTGYTAAAAQIAKIELRVGRFYFDEFGEEVDGRQLSVEVNGRVATHQSAGFTALQLPLFHAAGGHELNDLLLDPRVRPRLAAWQVDIDDSIDPRVFELVEQAAVAEQPNYACTFIPSAACRGNGTYSCAETWSWYMNGGTCATASDQYICCASVANGGTQNASSRKCGVTGTNPCGTQGPAGCAVCWTAPWSTSCSASSSGSQSLTCTDGGGPHSNNADILTLSFTSITFQSHVQDIHQSGTHAISSHWRSLMADISGDGKPDVCASRVNKQQDSSWTTECAVWTSSGTFNTVQADTLLSSDYDENAANPEYAEAVNVDTDSRKDLCSVRQGYAGNVSRLRCARSNGDGTFANVTSHNFSGIGSQGNGFYLRLAHINTDGKIDACFSEMSAAAGWKMRCALGNGDGTFGSLTTHTLLNPAAGSAPKITTEINDWNGDGSADRSDLLIDISGDGRADACVRKHMNTPSDLECFLGNGNGTFGSLVTSSDGLHAGPASDGSVYVYPQILPMDANGDGRVDLCSAWSGNPVSGCSASWVTRCQISSGNGSFGAVQVTNHGASGGCYGSVTAIDFDDDNRYDVCWTKVGEGSSVGDGSSMFMSKCAQSISQGKFVNVTSNTHYDNDTAVDGGNGQNTPWWFVSPIDANGAGSSNDGHLCAVYLGSDFRTRCVRAQR